VSLTSPAEAPHPQTRIFVVILNGVSHRNKEIAMHSSSFNAARTNGLGTRGLISLVAVVLFCLIHPGSAQAQYGAFEASSAAGSLQTFVASDPDGLGSLGGSTRGYVTAPAATGVGYPAFSRVGFGADISPLGIGFMTATNFNHHINLRMNASIFNYTASNLSIQSTTVAATVNLASARASVDYYPFHKGLRISPGFMFYNQNRGSAILTVPDGASFNLNNTPYWTVTGPNAMRGTGKIGFGNGSKAPTLTAGWGNVFPHVGRHLSFPFELGAAFTKTPTLAFNLSGLACHQNGTDCVNAATDPGVQANLAAQLKSYRDDLAALKTFPIASFGVAYNFNTRGRSMYR
jgi:hypothetical protein